MWEQGIESSLATVWMVLRMATESALRTNSSNSLDEGSLENKLLIDLDDLKLV